MFARTNRLKKFLRSFFQKATEGTGRVALCSAFLFGNFFFAPMPSKKKWVNDKLLRQFEALSTDTEIPLTLFLLRKKPQKKKLCKKKKGVFRLRGGRCYAQGATFEKVDKTIRLVRCEHSAQPFDKSKFEITTCYKTVSSLWMASRIFSRELKAVSL